MRNYNDPQYKKFRAAVRKRDGYCCQWPKCGSKKRLRVHHIRTWAQYPNLRFEVSNGITLCSLHHDIISRNEDQFIALFQSIIIRNNKRPNINDRSSRRGSPKKNVRKRPTKRKPRRKK